MTALGAVPLVGGQPAATNQPKPAPRLQVTFPAEQARWLALGDVEDGTKVGTHGEVGRNQILPGEWRKATKLPLSAAWNPVTERAVDELVMARRIQVFGRTPTDYEWFLLWHCPAHLRHQRPDEHDYAIRCLNLMVKYGK